jgi:hypothetical protein
MQNKGADPPAGTIFDDKPWYFRRTTSGGLIISMASFSVVRISHRQV